MGCNSTLTDTQLEFMFVMTDEEMRQIEQSMECLIYRTQHKRLTKLSQNSKCAIKSDDLGKKRHKNVHMCYKKSQPSDKKDTKL